MGNVKLKEQSTPDPEVGQVYKDSQNNQLMQTSVMLLLMKRT